jgi:chitinase
LAAVALATAACNGDDTTFTGATVGQGGAAGTGAANATTSASGGSDQGGAGQGGFDPAQDPVAQINHPGDMECRHPGMPFPCSGTATDPQDGALTGASLVWTSDVEGAIGTGESVMFTPTVEGDQIITLTGTDSDDNMGADQVTLVIAQQCP